MVRPTRKDLLKLIDQEAAWLEFLEQVIDVIPRRRLKLSVSDRNLLEKFDDITDLKASQRISKQIIHRIVLTRDLWSTVEGCWEEYPKWWIRKYG
jgi:hypothetical protein